VSTLRLPLPYPVLCLGLGAGLGWALQFLHGPIPYKFDVHYLVGERMVWAFYSARMLIGFWVGISTWPRAWWLRGPLCGFATMLPVVFVSLATPDCGWPCFAVNLASATGVGFLVAGLAFGLTGLHHREGAAGATPRAARAPSPPHTPGRRRRPIAHRESARSAGGSARPAPPGEGDRSAP